MSQLQSLESYEEPPEITVRSVVCRWLEKATGTDGTVQILVQPIGGPRCYVAQQKDEDWVWVNSGPPAQESV